MAYDTRTHARTLAALLVAVGFLLLAPPEAHAVLPDFATIVAPTSLQKLESHPVEIVVQFKSGARRESFRAWLNGHPITARFVATPTGVRASVDVQDGLRVGLESDPPLKTLNVLTTLVRGSTRLPDADLQIFFVREPSVEVPALIGLSSEAASSALAAAGLAVGAVSEEVRAAIRTGTVIGQSPVAGTEVARGSPVGLVRVAPPPHDIAIPDSWLGFWNWEITYRDAATGFIDSVMPVSDAICSADPIGVAAVEASTAANPAAGLTTCSVSATADRIDMSCSGEFEQIFCAVPATAHLTLLRSGDSLSGSGAWTVGEPCGFPIERRAQTIEVIGRRASPDPGTACTGPQSSLLQKFLKNNLLILLEGQL